MLNLIKYIRKIDFQNDHGECFPYNFEPNRITFGYISSPIYIRLQMNSCPRREKILDILICLAVSIYLYISPSVYIHIFHRKFSSPENMLAIFHLFINSISALSDLIY